MLTTDAILAGITTASISYIGLSLAAVNIKSRAKRVGGITFLRLAGYQLSVCRPRPQPVIAAERMAQATRRAQTAAERMAQVSKRAQTASQRRLDAIAQEWCSGSHVERIAASRRV